MAPHIVFPRFKIGLFPFSSHKSLDPSTKINLDLLEGKNHIIAEPYD